MSEQKPAEKSAKVTVFMVGNSRGNEHGKRRQFDEATAKRLVANGHARYPASKQE